MRLLPKRATFANRNHKDQEQYQQYPQDYSSNNQYDVYEYGNYYGNYNGADVSF